jgi:hypothetical protein
VLLVLVGRGRQKIPVVYVLDAEVRHFRVVGRRMVIFDLGCFLKSMMRKKKRVVGN